MVQLQQHSIAQEAMDINLAKVGFTAYYVDGTNGLDTYPGDSWEQPFKTINHAVDTANSWCQIFIRSKPNSIVIGTANAGQKVVRVVDPTGFAVGDVVALRSDSGTGYTDLNAIASISGTYLTMTDNLLNAVAAASNGEVVGYYDESVSILESTPGIKLTGESRYTTLICNAIFHPIYSDSNNISIEEIGTISRAALSGIYLDGYNCACESCMVDGIGEVNAYGVRLGGIHNTAKHIDNKTSRLDRTVHVTGQYCEVHDCVIDDSDYGIYLFGADRCKVHNNRITDCGVGILCHTTWSNAIYHNNLDGNTAQINGTDAIGLEDNWTENFFDNHITDTNHDGMADTAYTENDATDYHPVSHMDGWNQVSLQQDLIYQKVAKTITVSTAAVPVMEQIFFVSGEVECYVVGQIDLSVTSAGALLMSVGGTSDNGGFIPVTAKAELITYNTWVDATGSKIRPRPDARVVGGGENIKHYITGASAIGGKITYYCIWRPLSTDGLVVAA